MDIPKAIIHMARSKKTFRVNRIMAAAHRQITLAEGGETYCIYSCN
jgi:hypothetical protein